MMRLRLLSQEPVEVALKACSTISCETARLPPSYVPPSRVQNQTWRRGQGSLPGGGGCLDWVSGDEQGVSGSR